MSPIDQRGEQFAIEYSEKLSATLQQDLLAVILYGSATGAHFEPGKSNINLLVVLSELQPERFRAVSDEGKKYKLYGIEPLFLLEPELQQMPQSFPIEALELKENYRVFYGTDLIKPLQVSRASTGAQLLRELTAKAIRCRSFYELNQKDHKALDGFLRQLISPYRILMRTLIRWLDESYPPPQEFLEVVAQLEERLKLDLEGFRQAQLIKNGSLKLFKEEVRKLFEKIMNEERMLADIASQLVQQRAR